MKTSLKRTIEEDKKSHKKGVGQIVIFFKNPSSIINNIKNVRNIMVES